MEVLRIVKQYKLYKGSLQANGLYNLFDTETEMTSLWFDEETKESLMNMCESEFISYCEENIEWQKTKYTIEIEIIANSETGFEVSLDEVVKEIKKGCYLGMNGNEDEEYSFTVKKEKSTIKIESDTNKEE